MNKQISFRELDKALFTKLLNKGLYPIHVEFSIDGKDMGSDYIYFEEESGNILGTTHKPEPAVLMMLMIELSKPIRKYPKVSDDMHPGGLAIIGEKGREKIISDEGMGNGVLPFDFWSNPKYRQ